MEFQTLKRLHDPNESLLKNRKRRFKLLINRGVMFTTKEFNTTGIARIGVNYTQNPAKYIRKKPTKTA